MKVQLTQSEIDHLRVYPLGDNPFENGLVKAARRLNNNRGLHKFSLLVSRRGIRSDVGNEETVVIVEVSRDEV